MISRFSSLFQTAVTTVYNNRVYQFWLMQLIGWGGLGMVTFFSLTLWYATATWDHVSHTIVQSLLGMILSIPLHRICLVVWSRPILSRIGWSLLAVIVVSVLWTILRIYTFTLITGSGGIWADFGGWYFSSFLVYLCWVALYYGNKYYYQAQMEYLKTQTAAAATREEQLKRLKAEADAKSAQLGMLQYQLNPHFLFNTLNSISALVKFQEAEKAQKMITQLGHFLRYSLDTDPSLTISLQQEIEALMLYLDIERTRFGERLRLDFEVDDQAKRAQVPSLLLQPLAENSIKYAISANENGGTIKLRATVQQDELRLELTDTGPGATSEQPAPKTGRRVGLHNTLQRLKTLYDEAYMFDIDLHPSGGLKISIRIPYNPV
ncbi:MAG: histidine kinase [Xanthomonadales bacterium]|nr:histidine kinase [Xanthomonadales bacterium]